MHAQHTSDWDALTHPENTDMSALGCSHELLAALGNFLFHGSVPSYLVPEKPDTGQGF